MTRGILLEDDLNLLVNNPKYSDIEIICGDGKKLYGCRAILAARSEVLDGLLYNGMKESYEKQISFPTINSSVMEIVLKEAYTGFIKDGTLNKDNIIEVFYAADYFQLIGLREIAIDTLTNAKFAKTHSPELLSKVVNTMPLSEDNMLLTALVEAVATVPLNTIESGRLSIAALQYFLSYTQEKNEIPFATSEYEIFRYSALLAAKQVSNDACETLMELLPTLEQTKNSIKVENKNKLVADHHKVAKELEPLVKFIDLRRIKVQILANIIDPLEFIPENIFLSIYREKARSNNVDSNETRGTLYFWDDSAHGSRLSIGDNGKFLHALGGCNKYQNARAKMIIDSNGIFEWDVIIENYFYGCVYVGVCASEIDYQKFAGNQSAGWVLGSDGCFFSNSYRSRNYCPAFGNGAKITVHLDMNRKGLAFSVNGTKYPEVSRLLDLPSKLYPVVSLCSPAHVRIQPHQKIDVKEAIVVIA